MVIEIKQTNMLRLLTLAELIELKVKNMYRICDTFGCKHISHEYNYCVLCVYNDKCKKYIVLTYPTWLDATEKYQARIHNVCTPCLPDGQTDIPLVNFGTVSCLLCYKQFGSTGEVVRHIKKEVSNHKQLFPKGITKLFVERLHSDTCRNRYGCHYLGCRVLFFFLISQQPKVFAKILKKFSYIGAPPTNTLTRCPIHFIPHTSYQLTLHFILVHNMQIVWTWSTCWQRCL